MADFSIFINYLDILSYRPEIKVKGNSRFVTNLGIIIGFFCILTIIILSFFFAKDVISRTKFSIIYNLDNREIPRVNLNQSQAALLLIDPLGNELENYDRVFNFMVKYWKIQINSNYNQTNTTDYKETYLPKNIIIDIPIVNCANLNYLKYSPFYSTFSKVYKSGVCLDFRNFTEDLFGKYGGVEGYSTLNIYINKCVNSTVKNKIDCYPQDIIDKKLSQVFVSLITIENDIDSNNFINPITEFYKNELLPISSTIFKNYFKEINSVVFNSDDGYIFENYVQQKSYRMDKIIESVDLRGSNTLFPGTFSQITFRCSGKTEIFSRSYLKLPATAAYIGGILQVIILLGRFVVYLFSKNSMLSYLIFTIFDLNEINYFLNKNDKNISNYFFNKSKVLSQGNNEDSKHKLGLINSNLNKLNNKAREINLPKNSRISNKQFTNVRTIGYNKEAEDILRSNIYLNENCNVKNINHNYDPSNLNLQNLENKIKFQSSKNDFNNNIISEDQNNIGLSVNKIIMSRKVNKNKQNIDSNPLNKNSNIKKSNKDVDNMIYFANKDSNDIINNNNVINLGNQQNPNNSDLQNLNEMNQPLFSVWKNDAKLSEKIHHNFKKFNKPNESFPQILSFLELFCFKSLITDRNKRNFLKLTNKIIDKKLSLEYLLTFYSNFEKLKLMVLSKEQHDIFLSIPNFKLEKHLSEIIDPRKK